MFARMVALAATLAALVMSTVAACRNISFFVHVDEEFMQTESWLEINSLYKGKTGWYDTFNKVSCSDDRRYCYSVKYHGSDELLVTLLIGGIEYKFEKANKKHGYDMYEYWHCVEA